MFLCFYLQGLCRYIMTFSLVFLWNSWVWEPVGLWFLDKVSDSLYCWLVLSRSIVWDFCFDVFVLSSLFSKEKERMWIWREGSWEKLECTVGGEIIFRIFYMRIKSILFFQIKLVFLFLSYQQFFLPSLLTFPSHNSPLPPP